MSGKYKIKVKKEEVSDAEIAEYKNFNRVLSQYKRLRKPKRLHGIVDNMNKLVPLIILVILLIVTLVFWEKFQKKKEQKAPTPKAPVEQIEQSAPQSKADH